MSGIKNERRYEQLDDDNADKWLLSQILECIVLLIFGRDYYPVRLTSVY